MAGRKYLRRKLLQHPQIILKQQPDIVNLVPQQHRAVNAHAEGVARPLFGVYAAVAQHVGVNHTAAHDFEPA